MTFWSMTPISISKKSKGSLSSLFLTSSYDFLYGEPFAGIVQNARLRHGTIPKLPLYNWYARHQIRDDFTIQRGPIQYRSIFCKYCELHSPSWLLWVHKQTFNFIHMSGSPIVNQRAHSFEVPTSEATPVTFLVKQSKVAGFMGPIVNT